jgi:hypothetical protein
MIVKISRGSFVRGVIVYHETKVRDGHAELISNNTLGETTAEKVNAYLENFALNEKVSKNKFAHFSFSLKPGENITSGKFLEVARDYLEQMGYTDTPELIYRHFDKGHEHIHVISSSIQFSGKKISEYKDYDRSKEICRNLEAKFGLELVTGTSRTDKQLSEINAEKFSLVSALNKADKSGYAHGVLREGLPVKFSNEEFIKAYGKEMFDRVYGDLNRRDYIYKTDKMQMVEKLDFLYQTSRNRIEFLERVQQNGIYAREIQSKVQYGYNGKYFSERQLPEKFSNTLLTHHFGKTNVLPEKDQKFRISKEVTAVLRTLTNYDDFRNIMEYRGVEVKEARNSGGVYGLSFRLTGIENGEWFKASDIDRKLSFAGIQKQISSNLDNQAGNIVQTQKRKSEAAASRTEKGASAGNIKNPFSSPTDDPEDIRRKKKMERDSDPENDMNM